MRTSTRLKLSVSAFVAALSLLGLVSTTPAVAEVPALHVATRALPAHLPPGHEGKLEVEISNLGDAPAEAGSNPIVVEDALPEGLEATAASSEQGAECVVAADARHVRCEYHATIRPFSRELFSVDLTVKVAGSAAGTVFNDVGVSGGGSIDVHAHEAVTVSAEPAGFGVEKVQLAATNEDGSLDTQAGSHPFQLTATTVSSEPGVKDLRFDLPPGLVGNTNVVAQCAAPQFYALLPEEFNSCPAETAIGVARIDLAQYGVYTVPVFNLVPSAGEPARFGFAVYRIPIILDTSVRTGQGYGVTVNVNNIQQLGGFVSGQITFWGVPAEPVHNNERGWSCLDEKDLEQLDAEELAEEGLPPCENPGSSKQVPFLTLPTSCSGAGGMGATLEADSWQQPGLKLEPGNGEYTPAEGLTGCNRERFEPGIGVAPDGPEASTPTGLKVDVHVPQEGTLTPGGLAGSAVESITAALPAGMTINPAGGNSLEACSSAQIGFKGTYSQNGAAEFEPGAPSCPDASKIATVKLKTPLLPNPLEGEVYLASPQNFAGLPQNPFSSLVALYLVAEDPVSGVLVKLAGSTTPNPATGQLTATFEAPQVPFEDAEIHFFGSDRAPLSTPSLCGTYKTETSIVPWSGTPTVHPSSSFGITTGPDGSGAAGCTGPRQFTPGFQAGALNLQAGAFTPFTLTMSRPDQDQTLSKIDLSMPEGLSGVLSNVKLCPEAQANAGTCGPESLIGETIVSVGLGGDPYTVTGGKVYITEHYGGGQYGLSIVNPAKAGPFVLQEGRPVIVRAAIFVDPHTAALRIVTDPLPTIIDGIPLQIQHVNVAINGVGGNNKFTFNPTNCGSTNITATLGSSEGATSTTTTPFQVTNCANLKFAPKFVVATAGKTSKADGASLAVKLTYPTGSSYANIKAVKVDLPKQLPSRLTTLQKACLAKVFEANPANCPAASIVGHAKAMTPILPVPLEGPAYFVSHGGEAFPSLIVVLQGYGVTVDLVGTTFISHAGITSSTFKTVPDVPVGTFELNLPEGPHSALGTNKNLCTQKLAMPTAFVAQNGLEIHESTPVGVTGCPKTKKSARRRT
jgi:hypothetical protein